MAGNYVCMTSKSSRRIWPVMPISKHAKTKRKGGRSSINYCTFGFIYTYLHILKAWAFIGSQNWLVFTNYVGGRWNVWPRTCWVWVCGWCLWWSLDARSDDYTTRRGALDATVFVASGFFCVVNVNKRRQVVILFESWWLHVCFLFLQLILLWENVLSS